MVLVLGPAQGLLPLPPPLGGGLRPLPRQPFRGLAGGRLLPRPAEKPGELRVGKGGGAEAQQPLAGSELHDHRRAQAQPPGLHFRPIGREASISQTDRHNGLQNRGRGTTDNGVGSRHTPKEVPCGTTKQPRQPRSGPSSSRVAESRDGEGAGAYALPFLGLMFYTLYSHRLRGVPMKRGKKLPEPAVLLKSSRYWKKGIFFQFVELCDELVFRNPAAGLELALHAPAFAKKVASRTDRPQAILLLGYAVLATAYRATGDYRQAEKAYCEALKYSHNLTRIETADLKRRMAYLRLGQQLLEEALALVNEAIQAYRLEGDLADRDFLGRCYVARGTIHRHRGDNQRAIIDNTKALLHIDLKRSEIYYDSAIHNLAVAVATCPSSQALGEVLKLLAAAEHRICYKRNPMAKYKLKWLKGEICTRFGSTRAATRNLVAARDGFIKYGAVDDVLVTSLALAQVYFIEARPAWEVQALAEESYRLCCAMSAGAEAVAALAIWRDSAVRGELTDKLLRSLRNSIVESGKPASQRL